MNRLFVLSNRLPTDSAPAGGLIVALHDCLTAQGGVWIGCAEEPVATPAPQLKEIGKDAYSRMTFDVTQEEHEGFYLGYANSVLWPLFHWRSDLIDLDAGHALTYRSVNSRVAHMLAEKIQPGDVIWVHDYHFLPIAEALRRLGVTNRIGFFLHTPFPHAHDLLALPERMAFTRWLASYDLVGLQTQRDVAACLELFRGTNHAEHLRDGTLRFHDRIFALRSFPIGIDVDDFAAKADTSTSAGSLGLASDERLVIGVDRLDYTKGLVNRFEAFGTYLATRDPEGPRTTFLQIAQPSRGALDTYQDIRSALEATTGRLNGTYGQLDWTPIRYICRGFPREQIAGLYRRADVGLVTPLADGMNLVAKEYVAAQDPEEPGVLVLSRFAGAAEQLTSALLVNPYDASDVARAIHQAISMPLPERQERHAAQMEVLRSFDIDWWTDAFLKTLDRPEPVIAA